MIFLRLLITSTLLLVCDAQNGKYMFTKTQKKKKLTILRAKCVYKVSKSTGSKVTFDIGFDGPTSKMKTKQASVISQTGNVYSLTNKKPLKKKFTVAFSVTYKGDTVPAGTCSPLKSKEISTDSPTFGTYSPLSNTFEATIVRSWPDNGGTRIEALCMFTVTKKVKPNKKNFIIDFGTEVTKYEDWVGKSVAPKGNSGVWFHRKNMHNLQTPSLKFKFHATYMGNKEPTVLCSSDLPEFIATTQAPATTSEAPATTSEAPATTSEAPATTSQGPATTSETSMQTTRSVTTLGPVPEFPYSFKATVRSTWDVDNGTRTDAVCYFSAESDYEPETVYFRIDFGLQVKDFTTWVLKNIQPKGNTGSSFFMSNLNWITSDVLEVSFQATYPQGETPNIICNSDLRQKGQTGAPPGTTSHAPGRTTTEVSGTSTKTPISTDKSEGTTNGQMTTSQAPATTSTTNDGSYNEVLKKSIWFYRAQRSGHLPVVANDPVPWRGDSALYDGQDVGLDLTGGWYDAGDWVKFNLPISSAVVILGWGLVQWKDAYISAGQYDEMLDCIKWPLDFFLKCWREDENELYGQVGNGNTDHSKMMRPEEMSPYNMERPSYKVTSEKGGSDLAGSMAAAFAVGSIAFKTKDAGYSAKLLAAAESLYVFADTYRNLYTLEISDAANFYSSSGFNDELVYAAAMLYKATGKSKYLDDAEDNYNNFNFDGKLPWAFDWDDKTIATKVLLFEATGKSKYKKGIQDFLKAFPQGSVGNTPGGLAWLSKWGSLRYTANTAFIALIAADLGIDAEENKKWAERQIGYMLGDNPRKSSYVVGFGNNPPKQPHHKSSTCKPKPERCDWGIFSDTNNDNYYTLYGALVGGPDEFDNYKDDRTDYVMAEVTCDYNAGFQSAVAGLIHLENN